MNVIIYSLLKALHSKAGTLVQWIVGGGLGWLATLALKAGIQVPPEQLEKLQMSLVGFGVYMISALVQRYQAKQAASLQGMVHAKPDSWIGAETLRAVADLAQKALSKSPKS